MKSEIWDELAETRDCVYVITAKMPLEDYDYKISMNLWVYLNGLKISSTYIAHQSETLQEHSLEIYQDIKQGNLDENALYWFESEEYMLQAEKWMHCEVIDGYCLGWVT